MEHMDRIVLLDTNIERHGEALLRIPQYACDEGTQEAATGDLEED